ncbi:MAG: hypothetical protein ACOCVR_01245, partial [Myxococcota bacterium]
GRVAEALETAQEGLMREPAHPRTLAAFAEATALASSNPLEAARVVRDVDWKLSAQAADPVIRGRAQAALGLACSSGGEVQCRRRALSLARRLAPRDGRVLLLVGRALEMAGDARGAAAAYSAAAIEAGAEEALLRHGLLVSGAAASRLLAEFLERAPDHSLAPMARQTLERTE